MLCARGASYGRGAARSVASERLRLSNETITRAPRLRIGERGRGKSRDLSLLSLLGLLHLVLRSRVTRLPRSRAAEHAQEASF